MFKDSEHKQIIKPASLKAGDSVMFISPAAGLAGVFPQRVERGRQAIENLGFEVLEGTNSRIVGDTAGTPAQRAQDIHDALRNPAIKALISNIGGDFVCWEVLDQLDWKLIGDRPKIFMGYSDLTSLLLGLYTKAGLITFYGPAVITQFAEYPEPYSYTVRWMLKTLSQADPPALLEPSPGWTDELVDWRAQTNLKPRELQASNGWEWLQEGHAEGKLLGGCLQVLIHMYDKIPAYVPDFTGSIFFWESAESDFGTGYTPQQVANDLNLLKQKGVLAAMHGMIVGRPYKYNSAWHTELKHMIIETVADPAKPILYNVEIGHTDPVLTIPIGVRGRINSKQNLFSIDEAGVI